MGGGMKGVPVKGEKNALFKGGGDSVEDWKRCSREGDEDSIL